MKKHILSLLILLAAITTQAQIPTGTQGIGGKIGTYFGGTYKAYISSSSAVEGIIGFNWDFNTIGIMANYYMIQTDFYEEWDGLEWYGGLGGQLWIGKSTNIGPSATAGFEYTFEDAPFSLFADISMYLGIGNNGGFIPQFGGGLRKNF